MIRSQQHADKNKKKMKMVDLRTFVETKLLSRSEKNLEKLMQMEDKQFYEMVTFGSIF